MAAPAPRTGPTIAVVICAWTTDRWATIVDAIEVVRAQRLDGDEIVLVVDHAPDLLDHAAERWTDVVIVPNMASRGLSGARNTGVARSSAEVVAFLDDDAVPRAGWLDALRARFVGVAPAAMVGGAVEPAWAAGRAPGWFPSELGWVVGCDYRGMAGDGELIRNPIGASMAATRAALDAAGPFSENFGRTGSLPAGCEETELAIRLRVAVPHARIVRDTTAVVDHHVPAARARLGYVVSRCWHEGLSKAALAAAVGADGALASERSHALRMVTSGTVRHVAALGRGDVWGPARAGVSLLGLGVTASGYLAGRVRGAWAGRGTSEPARPATASGHVRPPAEPVETVEPAASSAPVEAAR